MKYHLCKKIYKFFIPLSMGYCFGLGNIIVAEEVNHNLPIQNINTNISSDNKLSKMPVGNLDSASKKVQINRNPFLEPEEIEFVNISNLNTSMNFKGLVQSQDKLMAIIATKDGQNLYRVGDALGSGFLIQAISLENVTVDISNGFRKYRLFLSNVKNKL
jgi:hypothetical protein